MLIGHTESRFISLSKTEEHMQSLDSAVTRKRLCTVFGPSGSGKTALVSYWARTRGQRAGCNPQEFPLFITLPRGDDKTPIEYTLLLRVYRALHRAAGTEYLLRQRKWREKYTRYSQRNLEYLDLQVAEMLDQMPICAVIIDNAHELNASAFDRALTLRTFYHEREGQKVRRALILVAKKEVNDPEHTLTELLTETPEALAAHGERINLSLLTKKDLLTTLIELIDEELYTIFSPAIKPDLDKIGKELDEFTRRNWHTFENFINNLDKALGDRTGDRRRVITRDVLDEAKRLTAAQRGDGQG